MSKKILFFGNERLATGVSTKAPIFKSLIRAGYDIKALIISASPNSNLDDEVIAKEAKKHGISVLNLPTLSGTAERLSSLGADTAILAAYGKIVPEGILKVFKHGIINVHPSLLPKHRGPTPLESVILNGEDETGVSIMQLVKDMDAGPVYIQKRIKLTGSESKQNLADRLGKLGSQLLIDNLEDILNGKLVPQDQDNSKATYDKLIAKEDGKIDWSLPAEKIINQIRAYEYWPRSTSTIGEIEIVITKAHLENNRGQPGKLYISGKTMGVYASNGLVIIEKLIPIGKREMPAESFIAGYGDRLLT